MSVDISTQHSDRHIGRDIGRHVGRHVDRHMSIDTSAESRSIDRPTYRSSIGRYVDRYVGRDVDRHIGRGVRKLHMIRSCFHVKSDKIKKNRGHRVNFCAISVRSSMMAPIKGEGHSRNRIFFVIANKKFTLS